MFGRLAPSLPPSLLIAGARLCTQLRWRSAASPTRKPTISLPRAANWKYLNPNSKIHNWGGGKLFSVNLILLTRHELICKGGVEGVSTLHLTSVPHSSKPVGWRTPSSKQMSLDAQMRTNGFSNHSVIKRSAPAFRTH